MKSLREAARIAVRDCLAVRAGESVLVITDTEKRKIGYAFWEAARDQGAEAMLTEIIPRKTHGQEPPRSVAEFMKHVNVFIAPMSRSISHTRARRIACELGARGATLPGITESMMRRALHADYKVRPSSLREHDGFVRASDHVQQLPCLAYHLDVIRIGEDHQIYRRLGAGLLQE